MCRGEGRREEKNQHDRISEHSDTTSGDHKKMNKETMVNLSPMTHDDSPETHDDKLHDERPTSPLHLSMSYTSDHLAMREVDADILELGVEEKRRADFADFDENGCRAVRAESFNSLPDDESVTVESDASGTEASRSPLKSAGSGSLHSMPQIIEEAVHMHPLQEEKEDYFVADTPDDEESSDDAALLRHQKGRHSRCSSFERRSLESAQFALAVGENSNLLLNKIIEEDSSSDFDDDDIDEAKETDTSIQEECTPSPIHIVNSTPSTPTSSPMDHQAIRMSTLAIHPPFVDWKFTRQYSSGGVGIVNEEFGYKGIRTSLLEITQRGVSRGNYAQLHRKAWLEVSDKYHRYGKNLRMYYKHWEGLGHPYSMFFDWLDSRGKAEGCPLPNLNECPRSVLDSDTVLYITDPEVSNTYALEIVGDQDGSAIVLDRSSQRPVCTGKEGWIFILRDHVMYGSQKVTAPGGASVVRQRFHHSSFFGGKAVASAGIFLTNDQGRLTDLWPHSGHYRPGEAHMQRALFFLQQQGVDLSTFQVDMQQIHKVSRKKSPIDKAKKKDDKIASEENEEQQIPQEAQHKKAKKTECLLNMGGYEVACFLAHKARMIEAGVFHQIHKIRKIPHEMRSSVSSALEHVNAQTDACVSYEH